jgi:ribonuclease HI
MELYIDGARGDDAVGIGWCLALDDGTFIEGNDYIHGEFTSMDAEFFALRRGIEAATEHSNDSIFLYSDCQPLLEKMESSGDGKWADRSETCHDLLDSFDFYRFAWTPRAANERADRLATIALDRARRE